MFHRKMKTARFARIATVTTVALLGLSACQTMTLPQAEGIGFREARFAEVSAVREWRSCRDDALALDSQARSQGSQAKYLASAKLLSSCEADIGPEAASKAQDERMRAYALSVQNFLKGGDITNARQNLESFKKHFAGQDLYLADGSSFVQSMDILLGLKERSSVGTLAMTNVSDELKSELRRANYWQHQ